MIRIDRKAIDLAKSSLFMAFGSAKTNTGLKLKIEVRDDILEKAVMLALQSLTMDVISVSDVAVPSDIGHLDNFGDSEA
jgi:hypothetical protein